MTHFFKQTLLIVITVFIVACSQKPKQKEHIAGASLADEPQPGPISLVIHGGAGTILKENMTEELEMAYREKLAEALNKGYEVLEKGGSSLDAVKSTIQILEASPLFNAGIGAVFTNEGKNELDASIMDGASGMAGSVAGISSIKSPILAAYEVMVNSSHVMMSGKGAEVFAKQQGLEEVEPSYFHTEKRFQQLKKIKKAEKNGKIASNPDKKYGTVGAVALDQKGNIAAGTSTGGMTNKRFGRIGDSPIIGAGTYANNKTCGISATGHGEYFIRGVVAYDVAAMMEYKGFTLKQATEQVVMKKLEKIGGKGGVIALDREGNISMPFNTPGMYRGYINQKGKPKVFLYKD